MKEIIKTITAEQTVYEITKEELEKEKQWFCLVKNIYGGQFLNRPYRITPQSASLTAPLTQGSLPLRRKLCKAKAFWNHQPD